MDNLFEAEPFRVGPRAGAPLVVGIAGGTASGKSTVARRLSDAMRPHSVSELDLDSYYRDFSGLSLEKRRAVNWDEPKAIDIDEFVKHLGALRRRESIWKPRYRFDLFARDSVREEVRATELILVEGLFVLFDQRIRDLLDVKVFVDLDADLRFIRRLRRDVIARERSLEYVIEQYLATVRPMHGQFVEPSKAYADLILPSESSIGLSVLASSIKRRLDSCLTV